MEDNIRLAGIESRLGSLTAEAAGVKSDVGTIKSELSEVRRDVSSINGGISALKWIIGLFFLGATGLFFAFGKTFVRETAREVLTEVVQSEMRHLDTRVQFGAFSKKTKTSDDPVTFEWKLSQPLTPDDLISMTAEPLTPVPGVSIHADLANGGSICRMVVTGNTAAMLAKLDAVVEGIPGKVTTTARTQ